MKDGCTRGVEMIIFDCLAHGDYRVSVATSSRKFYCGSRFFCIGNRHLYYESHFLDWWGNSIIASRSILYRGEAKFYYGEYDLY